MGTNKLAASMVALLMFYMALAGGCAAPAGIDRARWAQHRQSVNASGLQTPQAIEAVRVSAAIPSQWELTGVQSAALYTHQQWRSPTRNTATGALHIKMPLPLGAKAVAWLAGREYANSGKEGAMLGRWSDGLGREWFEATTGKYFVRGYVVTRGRNAWINYMGYRSDRPPVPAEQELARRSLETVMPLGTIRRTTSAPATRPTSAGAPVVMDSR